MMGSNESIRCRYCRGERLRAWREGIRDRLAYVQGEWRFLKCADCGSAVLDPMPPPATLSSLYPPTYCFTRPTSTDTLAARLRKELEYRMFFAPQYEGQVRAVMRLLGKRRPGSRLLDVGCGAGLRLQAFLRRGLEVQGTELEEHTARDVRARVGVPVEQCAANDILSRFGPSTFDVVTAYYVVEHLWDVADFFRQCFEVLTPGGLLVVTVPLVDSVQAEVLGARWPSITEAPRHLSLPSAKGLSSALRDAGFPSSELSSDSSLMCAAQYGMALLPGGGTTQVGGGRALALLQRLAGAAVSAAALPWVVVEGPLLGRPGLVCAVGHKP